MLDPKCFINNASLSVRHAQPTAAWNLLSLSESETMDSVFDGIGWHGRHHSSFGAARWYFAWPPKVSSAWRVGCAMVLLISWLVTGRLADPQQ